MGKLFLPKNRASYDCMKVTSAINFSKTSVEIRVADTSKPTVLPRFENKSNILTESNSIAKALSNQVLWGHNEKEKALVYQWINFSDFEVYPSVCVMGFPLLGLRSYSKKDNLMAASQLERCLKMLDDHLISHMYLVGESITQADITCASALLLAFQMFLGPEYRQQYVNTTRWFRTIANQPEFIKSMNVKLDSKEIHLCSQTPNFNEPFVPENKNGDGKAKSASQLKKEAKKREKLEKFNKKMQSTKASAPKKAKPSEKAEKHGLIKYEKTTAPGEKKDVSGALPESYSPQYVEAAWYSWWENQGFFKPEFGRPTVHDNNPIFMICLPPPNVTGSLHLGHALTNTVEDVLTRWHRMKGETSLWNPGTDHAGIATQVVVEKKLWKERKLRRHDIGRKEFVEEVWKWKNEKGNRINDQLRRLGSSLDWSREFFTMNDRLSSAVKESFIRLHDKGTIFRSNRLVNWSCTLKSAISDIEVNKQELQGRTLLTVPGYDEKVEFGVLITFAYPVDNSDEELLVATTRIETMLGDTAVAVHPKDDRFKHLHGKFVVHPFCGRLIPIVCDEMVERDFGTGAVKITPSHDPNDYECGKRHNLDFINIFTDDGFVANTKTKFDGMKRFNARKAVLQDLKDKGLYRETKENPMVVPICSRSKDVVEPLIKLQWFMDCNEIAKKAVDAVKNGDLKLIPESHNKTWFHWLENIRDWCISRQLWWGHRIPAYFISVNDPNIPPGNETDGNYWISGRTEDEVKNKAAKRFNVCPSLIEIKQDEDVLDTWFSSGLLPFSIFGWPNETPDLKKFFPGTLLETGHDILFFWVARMVMFSIALTGKLPFKEVYLHAMVRDAHGRKMSKSLGNVIDPTDVITGITLEDLHKSLLTGNLDEKEIEKAKAGQKQDYPNGIPECGTDALRFALCAYTCQGRDINLDVNRILGYRHFCNKLWNAFKFALRSLGNDYKPPDTSHLCGKESLIDKWILNKLARAVEQSSSGLETYEFPTFTTAVFNFWLYELCDIYLECLKPVLNSDNKEAIKASCDVLYTCLDVALRITQCLMPFICEELWQRLPRRRNDLTQSVSLCKWPNLAEHNWINIEINENMDFVMGVVKVIRSLRAEYQLTKTKADLYINCTDCKKIEIATDFANIIKTLSYSKSVTISSDKEIPAGCAVAIVDDKCDVHLMLKGIVEPEKEIAKLAKKQEDQQKRLEALKQKMSLPKYQEKVPTDVQESDLKKVNQMEAELAKMYEAKETFTRMLS